MSILSIFAGLTGCGKSKEPVESNKESEVVSESAVQESEQTEEATEADYQNALVDLGAKFNG